MKLNTPSEIYLEIRKQELLSHVRRLQITTLSGFRMADCRLVLRVGFNASNVSYRLRDSLIVSRRSGTAVQRTLLNEKEDSCCRA
jgi:hypothetical protein